ncbi:MAG: ATP-binding cassette domain-containing protein [Coriobacteriia bacterium]|nr:ATP-binding cassette domain-containing protein [Coriobacteriia bacterium]
MLLLAENLTYRMSSGGPAIFDGVHIGVEAGELVDVTGPSGAGKTTLLRALARLLPGATGTLVLAGAPAERVVPAEWRRHVALVPQRAVMCAGSVRDNLLIPWRLKVRNGETPPPDDALREALDSVGLADIALGRDASRLSVGEAARVSLLRTTLTAADVLLLDEPDANLDNDSAEQVRAITERFVTAGGAVIRVRHLRSDSLATRRLRLTGGHLTEVVTDA